MSNFLSSGAKSVAIQTCHGSWLGSARLIGLVCSKALQETHGVASFSRMGCRKLIFLSWIVYFLKFAQTSMVDSSSKSLLEDQAAFSTSVSSLVRVPCVQLLLDPLLQRSFCLSHQYFGIGFFFSLTFSGSLPSWLVYFEPITGAIGLRVLSQGLFQLAQDIGKSIYFLHGCAYIHLIA